MASVNFEKLKTTQEVRAMMAHSETNYRLSHEHSNAQIDKSRTPENWQSCKDLDDALDRYTARIRQLDDTTNTNKRKDRVTCFSLCIPAADGMSPTQAQAFLRDCWAMLQTEYGPENCAAAFIHGDETHAYLDAVTGQQRHSRIHMHVFIIPESGGQLNGKRFSSKAAMQRMNRKIDAISREKYGLQFMDGSGKKSTAEVEQLKHASRKKAAEMTEELQSQVEAMLQDAQAQTQKVEELRAENEAQAAQIHLERRRIREAQQALDDEKAAQEKERQNLEVERKRLQEVKEEQDKNNALMEMMLQQIRQMIATLKHLEEEFKNFRDAAAEEAERLRKWTPPLEVAIHTLQDIHFKDGRTGYDIYKRNLGALPGIVKGAAGRLDALKEVGNEMDKELQKVCKWMQNHDENEPEKGPEPF